MKRVLVAGAGLGGLAAAARLARSGHAVEVWEKNEGPGGKLKELRRDGFSWGTGPSLLTMPDVLRELFADLGERLEDHLELVPLEPSCRYFWIDGTVIDEGAALCARDLRAFRRGFSSPSARRFLARVLAAQLAEAASPRQGRDDAHTGE